MNRYQKLFSNTAILGVGTFASKLLVFVLMPFYTAWLSTEDFGTAELITSIANFLIPLACVGLSVGIFRFAAEREADQTAVFSSGIALLGISLGAFLLLSPLLLLVGYLRPYVWLIVLYVLMADVQAVCAQYLRANDRTVLFSLQGILNTLITVGLNILFLFVCDMGVLGYVLSVVIGNAVTVTFLVLVARLWRVFRVSSIRWSLIVSLLRFSLPMVPTTICWLITDLSDRSMVTAICSPEENGIYSAAYKIPTIVTLVSSIFLQAWQFSAVAEHSSEAERRKFYESVLRGFLSVVMIGAACLILCADPLAAILLDDAYASAVFYMPTLLCAAAFEAIVSFLATIYFVRKKSMHSFLTALVGAIFNVLLNLLLIPVMGALGAAIATVASYALVMVVRLIDTHRMIPFHLPIPRLIISTLLLGGLCTVATVEALWGRLGWMLALTAAIVLLNAPALLTGIKRLLERRRRVS